MEQKLLGNYDINNNTCNYHKDFSWRNYLYISANSSYYLEKFSSFIYSYELVANLTIIKSNFSLGWIVFVNNTNSYSNPIYFINFQTILFSMIQC